MPEQETRMSRLHKRKAYDEYRDGGTENEALDMNEQTQFYDRRELAEQWSSEWTSYDESDAESRVYANDIYNERFYDDRDDITASSSDFSSSREQVVESEHYESVQPYSIGIDRFLNNALILVTVLLLVVLVIMFIL